LRPELPEQAGVSKNFGPHVLIQFIKLRLKLITDLNSPLIMHYTTYAVKCIFKLYDFIGLLRGIGRLLMVDQR